jgi:hypothetical protein
VEGVAAALDSNSDLHLGIDALYYDGIGFSHTIMRRVRRLLDAATARPALPSAANPLAANPLAANPSAANRSTGQTAIATGQANGGTGQATGGRVDLHCGNNFLGDQYGKVR